MARKGSLVKTPLREHGIVRKLLELFVPGELAPVASA
jgi:hypothetical protein